MKVAIVGVCVGLIGITMLPVLASGEQVSPAGCGPAEAVLATIRALESGGNYSAQAAGSTASGAYQFLNSSWNSYGGYHRAADAPPAVQDAKAAELVATILEQHNDDVAAIPVVWYIGHVPKTDSIEWDTIPYPNVGNVLTPRQYQRRWLSKLDERLAPSANDGEVLDSAVRAGSCTTGSRTTTDGGRASAGIAVAGCNSASCR